MALRLTDADAMIDACVRKGSRLFVVQYNRLNGRSRSRIGATATSGSWDIARDAAGRKRYEPRPLVAPGFVVSVLSEE